MKKVHGRAKRKYCMRTHINGAKAVKAIFRKATQNISKLSKAKK